MNEAPRILVVDDDPDLLVLAAALLQAEGFEPVTCRDPAEAASLAAERRVAAVVLDRMMPGLSGLEVLEALRTQPATRDVPVLMLSALSRGEDRVSGLKAGADDYLSKPFDPEELVIRLRRMLERSREREAVLEGRLGRLAVGDILQQLLTSRMEGVLELDGDPRGRVEVARGALVRAEYGARQGEAALLELLDHRRGRFRFREEAVSGGQEEPLGLQSALMRLAWLEDELERRRELLPDAGTPLEAREGAQPPESECESLGDVLEWVRDHPGATIEDLGNALPVARQEIAVAVTMLREAGCLVARGAEAARPPRRVADTAELRPRMEAAVHRLAKVLAGRGVPSALIKVVVAVAPERWREFLTEEVEPLPGGLLDRPKSDVLEELAATGLGTLRIGGWSSSVLLHCHRLAGLPALKARASLPLAAAVVVVASEKGATEQQREVLEAVSALESPPLAVVVPPRGGELARGELPPPWRMVPSSPTGIEGLLELLARAGA